MNVDHALADLYNDERQLRHFYNVFWALLIGLMVLLAIGSVGMALVLWFFNILFLSITYAKEKRGYNRAFWTFIVGIDGLAVEEKRELLAEYRLTDKSDLEGLEP